MRWFRTWSGRLLVGAVLGVLIVLGWIRLEAHIAETPVATARPEESGIRNQESGEPKKNFSPSVSEGERPVPRSFSEVGEGVVGVVQSERVKIPTPTDSPLPPPLAPPRAGGEPSRREGEKPATVRLDVSFVSQAPFRVWDLPYKEYCEEASVLTLHYWKQGVRPPAADQIDRDLKDIQAWEEVNLRTWDDTTAEETARVLREKFGHPSVRVVRDVTIGQITAELDAGRPVIVPAAGRELSSPYYKPPGPLYHMLVIIGYDEATREFITNDVGTNTKGAGFRFTYDDLYGAMGDWDVERKEPDTNQKVMIVVP